MENIPSHQYSQCNCNVHATRCVYIQRILANDKSLTEIDLSERDLTDADIEPLIKALIDKPASALRIRWLNLSHNKLTSPPRVNFLKNLEMLNLSNNKIKTPPDLTSLENLFSLMLSNNELVISPDLNSNIYLKWLYLSNNGLTIPPDVTKLKILEILYLDNNKLEIPPNLDGLIQLRELHLSNNQLKRTPRFNGRRTLNKINLSNNQLTTPPDLEWLEQLASIDLSNNRFSSLPFVSGITADSHSVLGFKNLSYLSVQGNPLTTLSKIAYNFVKPEGFHGYYNAYYNWPVVGFGAGESAMLTDGIIREHFQSSGIMMEHVKSGPSINHYMAIAGLLELLPPEVVSLIIGYLLPDYAERDLENLACMFSVGLNRPIEFNQAPDTRTRNLPMIYSYQKTAFPEHLKFCNNLWNNNFTNLMERFAKRRAGASAESTDTSTSPSASSVVDGAFEYHGFEVSLQTVDAFNSHGHSALTYSLEIGDYKAAKYLINHMGADVRKVNKFGSTPLHVAIDHYKDTTERNDIILLLLRNGAFNDVELANDFGNTPISLAEKRGCSHLLMNTPCCMNIAAALTRLMT